MNPNAPAWSYGVLLKCRQNIFSRTKSISLFSSSTYHAMSPLEEGKKTLSFSHNHHLCYVASYHNQQQWCSRFELFQVNVLFLPLDRDTMLLFCWADRPQREIPFQIKFEWFPPPKLINSPDSLIYNSVQDQELQYHQRATGEERGSKWHYSLEPPFP